MAEATLNPDNGHEVSPAPPDYLKVILIGDSGVGKSSFVRAYFGDNPPITESKWCAKAYRGHLNMDGAIMLFQLWDIPGGSDYDMVRAFCFPDSHLVLYCYAIDSPQSLNSIKDKWIPEVTTSLLYTPSILVGFKKDLRDCQETISRLAEEGLSPLSYQQGLNLMDSSTVINRFIECSAKTGENVPHVIRMALRYHADLTV